MVVGTYVFVQCHHHQRRHHRRHRHHHHHHQKHHHHYGNKVLRVFMLNHFHANASH